MKDLYKRLYTQKEIESYDVQKLENMLEDGKKYPFARHSGLYVTLMVLIFMSLFFFFGVYSGYGQYEKYKDMNLMQVMMNEVSNFISESSKDGTAALISGIIFLMLIHNCIFTIPLLLLFYLRDRKFAKHRTPLYHKNVELLQHELDIKKDVEAKYQERVKRAQDELQEVILSTRTRLEEKYNVKLT